MTDTNKSYRIRTQVGTENTQEYLTVSADLIQDYDTFEVLSVNIKSKDAYRLHNSNYGVVVGRVIANNGFGIPNAKISIFIPSSDENGADVGQIYPFSTTVSKDKNGARYNLLPNERINGCHQVVGTFPSKRYTLDNDVVLEVFDDYYTYTTKTNNAGDYMICGVPVGSHTLHMDLDLSDCGILSQKPRDFVYKGYTVEQFESPTKFKGGTDYNNLSQVFTQDQVVNVNPFWGNDSLGETIGITRADIDVNFKFEPTCVFMGSIVSDNASNGFSKKCIPTENMGNMEELVTGEGKIEMIRKTPGGSVEQFSVKGDKLINGDGVWCYQIPMNLDYMVTDEYGNMVPTDNPEKGVATRASVRFRISMEDSEENTDNFFRGKVLVPHNPQVTSLSNNGGVIIGRHEDYDYEFGTYTKEESFRDLFWNNVYSVKSYIPRIQKSNGWWSVSKKTKFSGIKHCQNYGPNNPMPYNNIRIRLPFMFTIMCVLIKTFVFVAKIINTVITFLGYVLAYIGTRKFLKISKPKNKKWIRYKQWQIAWAPILPGVYQYATKMKLIVLKDGLCPDLENWFFAPLFYIMKNGNFVPVVKNYMKGSESWIFGFKITRKSKSGGPGSVNGLHSYQYLCGCEEDEANTPETSTITTPSSDDDGESEENYIPCSRKMEELGVNCKIADRYDILQQTLNYVLGLTETGEEWNGVEEKPESIDDDDPNSIDDQNADPDDETHCLTTKTDYLLPCIEMNLAQEYKVINFDFYNDWINGVIYNPRWVRYKKKKVRFLWITWAKEKIKGCMDDSTIFGRQRNYVQQCSIAYKREDVNGYKIITKVENPIKYTNDNPPKLIEKSIVKSNNFHKKGGLQLARVFGRNGGICHEGTTLKGQKVYYLKPCEFTSNGKKINLYATDIILLGTFNDCDINGIPQTFQHLTSTTYIMPTNLALTNMDTNGPLYATDDGTICMGDNGTKPGAIVQYREIMKRYYEAVQNCNANSIWTMQCIQHAISQRNSELAALGGNYASESNLSEVKQTLGNEKQYFTGAINYDITDSEIFRDNETYGDTIALTEAAGIAWNYTGPGQGEINKEKMYYPGGHFLGLTCVNSQTNIKSCLNLSRICEIGTNMSQRREDVREVDSDGMLRYTYSVPTGFISGDEIIDSDFRSMFATLNQKRLKATKRNPLTGYLIYDFEFGYPINFDGALKNIVYDITYNESTPYNVGINDIEEEDLTEYGVRHGYDNDDYDEFETENTQTRTKEITSSDYYAFRFGLTHNQLKDSKYSKHKFLNSYTNLNSLDLNYYLPQYENSYYFYFGLKQGATALDEFNKQFYAECDDLKIKKNPNLILVSDLTNFCEGKGKIRVMTEGLSLPYQSIEVYCYNTDERYVIGTRPQYSAEMMVLNQETFYLPKEDVAEYEFKFGKYRITVIDDDDISISKDIEFGTDLFHYNLSLVNFTHPIDENGNDEFNIFNGGFVLIEDFYCDYHDEDAEYVFQLKDEESDSFIGDSEYIEYPDDDIYWHLAYAVKKDYEYDLYLRYRCDGGEFIDIKITTVKFKDNSYLELRIGEDGLYYETPLYDSMIMDNNYVSWWWDRDNYDIGADVLHDDYKRWFYRKMFMKQDSHTTFNSSVYAHGGQKVIWGVPQSRNELITMNGWSRIYCSKREYELPSGTYLNDENTLRPTYGVDECMVEGGNENTEERSRDGNNGNCTFNYCAQAYNGDEVSGMYGFKYDKNGHYSSDVLQPYSNYSDGFFHERYGCVFKPLPYGNLVFLEYNSVEDLAEKIENTTNSKFGIVYPTFIYPVMKRPFFANFKMVIWSDANVYRYNDELGNLVYSEEYREFGGRYALSIHNGVTYSRMFESVSMQGGEFNDYVYTNYTSFSGDTLGLEECENTDRIANVSVYYDECISEMDGYDRSVRILVEEKVPDEHTEELSSFADTLRVQGYYSFDDNMLYRQDVDTNKIDYVSTVGSDNLIYYIGHYSPVADNISFLEPRNIGYDGKYAYDLRESQYKVLCRFNESVDIHISKWYTNVFVDIYSIHGFDFSINYRYLNAEGVEKSFNKLVNYPHHNTYYSVHPYTINEVLDAISNGYAFEIEGGGEMIFPFKPVLNYSVTDRLEIGNTEYSDFKTFMQKLIQKKQLVPVDHLSYLKPVEEDSIVFGIGEKIIPSAEGNDITSNIYKVYPTAFRSFYNTIFNDDYELIVNPDPYSGGISGGTSGNTSGNTMNGPYTVGKGEHHIRMTVADNSPCLIKFKMSNGNGWCNYSINNETFSDEASIMYNGNDIIVYINTQVNTSYYERNCTLTIQAYFGCVRDTVNVPIKQFGRNSSPIAYVSIIQDFPEQIDEHEIHAGQVYAYKVRMEVEYERANEFDNYVTIYPNGTGAVSNRPYVPVFGNPDYIPSSIYMRPHYVFEKQIVVNNMQNAYPHIPFEMYYDGSNATVIDDTNSDYIADIREEYF